MKVRISPTLKMLGDGIGSIKCTDYIDLDYVFSEILIDHPYLIYWGQANSEWLLKSSIDRLLYNVQLSDNTERYYNEILEKFKYSTRGRLPQSWIPVDDNSWWALGQHFGLATPLLDWTESPFVAQYFAYWDKFELNGTLKNNRVIYALDPFLIKAKNSELEPHKRLEIIKPLHDYNSRLVNQRGLFLRLPVNTDVKLWTKENFKNIESHYVLIEIVIPENIGDREKVLRYLNRANINHLTLFPDVSGSAIHSNACLVIPNYE